MAYEPRLPESPLQALREGESDPRVDAWRQRVGAACWALLALYAASVGAYLAAEIRWSGSLSVLGDPGELLLATVMPGPYVLMALLGGLALSRGRLHPSVWPVATVSTALLLLGGWGYVLNGVGYSQAGGPTVAGMVGCGLVVLVVCLRGLAAWKYAAAVAAAGLAAVPVVFLLDNWPPFDAWGAALTILVAILPVPASLTMSALLLLAPNLEQEPT